MHYRIGKRGTKLTIEITDNDKRTKKKKNPKP